MKLLLLALFLTGCTTAPRSVKVEKVEVRVCVGNFTEIETR